MQKTRYRNFYFIYTLKKSKIRLLSKGKPDLQKNAKERELLEKDLLEKDLLEKDLLEKDLLEKDLQFKSRVREKVNAAHIQLKKEHPTL